MFFVFQCIERAQHLYMLILVLAARRANGEVLCFRKPLQFIMSLRTCSLSKIFTETSEEFQMRRMRPREVKSEVTHLEESRVLTTSSVSALQRNSQSATAPYHLQRMVQSGLHWFWLGHVNNSEPIIWPGLVTATFWNLGWNQFPWITQLKLEDGKSGADMG